MAKRYAVESEENIQDVEGPNQNLSQEDVKSDEKRDQKIKELRERSQTSHRINIVVIGHTGIGKSTLINNLMGREVAKVSHGIRSAQFKVEVHPGEHNEIQINIFDTVGFGDSRGKSNYDILDEINAEGKFDLVLLCIDITRKADRPLQDLLSDLKSNLHTESWKHLVVVLMQTNQFIQCRSNDMEGLTLKPAVDEKITEFKGYMHSEAGISDHVGKNTFDKIPFCIAGTATTKIMLEEDWLRSLWTSCIDQCSEEAYPFLKDFVENELGFNDVNPRRRQGNPGGQDNLGDQRNWWQSCLLF